MITKKKHPINTKCIQLNAFQEIRTKCSWSRQAILSLRLTGSFRFKRGHPVVSVTTPIAAASSFQNRSPLLLDLSSSTVGIPILLQHPNRESPPGSHPELLLYKTRTLPFEEAEAFSSYRKHSWSEYINI